MSVLLYLNLCQTREPIECNDERSESLDDDTKLWETTKIPWVQANNSRALDGVGFDIPPNLSNKRMLASAVYDFHAEDTERGAKATMSTHCCQWKTSNAKNESGNREQINNFELQMSQTTSDANSPVGLDNGLDNYRSKSSCTTMSTTQMTTLIGKLLLQGCDWTTKTVCHNSIEAVPAPQTIADM